MFVKPYCRPRCCDQFGRTGTENPAVQRARDVSTSCPKVNFACESLPPASSKLFAFCERFGDIASAVDKHLGQWAQRPLLEGEDIKPAERCGEIDGQLSDRRILAGHAYDASGDDGKKWSRRCQTDPHVDCVGVDRRARGFDTVRTKCLDNERVVSASGRRPGPRFIR